MTVGRVILVHGLWLNTWFMGILARRLRRAGLVTETFGYAATRDGLERSARRLVQVIRSQPDTPVAIVAHSLGGIVTAKALAGHTGLPVRRVVLLGSPMVGSAVARQFSQWRFGGWLLGGSREDLVRGAPPLSATVQWAMIAGTLPLGIARFIGRLPLPNDGVVALAETRVPGLAGHWAVPVNHMGLIFSRRVAAGIIRFLEQGRF